MGAIGNHQKVTCTNRDSSQKDLYQLTLAAAAVGKVRSFLKAHCWKREREREKCLRSPNIVKSVYIVEWLYGIHTCGLFR